MPGECPAPENVCKTAICEGNTCGLTDAAAKTPCTDGGKFCDGAGSCVACATDVHCQTNINPNPCNGSLYTAPPKCKSGACELAQPQDCGADGLCSPAGCMPCVTAKDCGPPEGVCSDKQCNSGVCETHSLTQGSECSPPAVGTCNGTGICALRKYVFVTSTLFPPAFGSAEMADMTCTDVADAAGLGGAWRSWTSDDMWSPVSRFEQSADPYVYVLLDDITKVASNWDALTSGTLTHGIDVDENKKKVVAPLTVWTGTDPGGNHAGSSCVNWTSTGMVGDLGYVGTAGEITFAWTKTTKVPCNIHARLYCFQQ